MERKIIKLVWPRRWWINVCQYTNVSFFKSINLAIIGAGVGGTSTAYFLSELLDKKASDLFNYEIDVFEQSNKVGGRVATIRFDDKEYEAGGSIIHERNRYATEFLYRFGKIF